MLSEPHGGGLTCGSARGWPKAGSREEARTHSPEGSPHEVRGANLLKANVEHGGLDQKKCIQCIAYYSAKD